MDARIGWKSKVGFRQKSKPARSEVVARIWLVLFNTAGHSRCFLLVTSFNFNAGVEIGGCFLLPNNLDIQRKSSSECRQTVVWVCHSSHEGEPCLFSQRQSREVIFQTVKKKSPLTSENMYLILLERRTTQEGCRGQWQPFLVYFMQWVRKKCGCHFVFSTVLKNPFWLFFSVAFQTRIKFIVT